MALPAIGALLARLIPTVLESGAAITRGLGITRAAGVAESAGAKAAQTAAARTAATEAGEKAVEKAAAPKAPRMVHQGPLVIETMMGNARNVTAAVEGRAPVNPRRPRAPAAPSPGARPETPRAPAAPSPGVTEPAAEVPKRPYGSIWDRPPKPWQGERPEPRPPKPPRAARPEPPALPKDRRERNPFLPKSEDGAPPRPTGTSDGLRTTPPREPTPMSRKVDVKQETQDLSMAQRWERLQKLGQMVNRAETARRLGGIENPTPEQRVQVSEQQEQRNRNSWGQEGKSPGWFKKGVESIFQNPVKSAVAFSLAVATSGKAAERFGTRLLESQEPLRRFSGAINTTFAQLERQHLVLQGRTAMATSGSASALGNQLKKLRDDLQPQREALASAMNMAGTGVVYLGRIATAVVQSLKLVQLAEWLFPKFEEWLGKKPDAASEYQDYLRAVARGEGVSRPKARGVVDVDQRREAAEAMARQKAAARKGRLGQ